MTNSGNCVGYCTYCGHQGFITSALNPSDNELLELLKSMLGNKVLKTTVPFSRVIKNSFSFRLTAKEYMKWTAAATAFENLAAEIIERTENGI